MLMHISSGKGPSECELAVGLFLKALMKEFKEVKVVEEVRGQYIDCYKSLVISVDEDLSFLEGTIKWICKSPFRPKHKRKNWFIDVSIHKNQEKIQFSEKLIRFETFRCGGNGGQNVNKVESGVRAIHISTGTAAVCTEARTQHINKKLALQRLSEIIEQRNLEAEALAKEAMWIQHELLEKGNAVRVYEGMDFRRKR